MAFFTISKSAEFSGATVVFPDGSTQTIASDNSNYQTVVDGLLDGSLTDDDLLNLIAPFEAIYKTLTKLSERVARKGSKLLFDGDVVNNALTAFIIELMNEGKEDSWQAYIRFMEKLYTNPSKASQEHLFHFIESNGLQVTPDGDIVLYKGTQEDGYSTREGYGIVNGVEIEHGKLLNGLGSIIEIPRSKVDENRAQTCSTGLHVGAFEYVTGQYYSQWPKVWTVIVNPRDVVAVPHDFKSSKIRVARYVVVEHNKDVQKHKGLVWTPPAVKLVEPAKPKKVEKKPDAKATVVKAVVQKAAAGSRVEEYKALIQSGGAGKDLKRFRNKRVTAGRRAEFDQAVSDLGLQY